MRDAFSVSRRQHLAALLVLVLAGLCCFHKLTLHPGDVLVSPQNRGANDLVNAFLPLRTYPVVSRENHGQAAMWNPHICLGLPYVGNPQAALWYPPNWLFHLRPTASMLSWLLVAHHVFGGLGVYLLCRRLHFQWLASVAGGVVFLSAPFLMMQSAEGHYAQIAAIAWAPWAFLSYESFRAGRPSALLWLPICLAMSFLAGHAQETYYLVLLLTGFLTFDAVARYGRGEAAEGNRLIGGWLRIGFFTAALVAIDLLPVFLNSRNSIRPHLPETAAAAAFSLDNLLELLSPFSQGRPADWEGATAPIWETLCHFGIVPLVLGLSAVLVARTEKWVLRMTVVWIVTLLFALGTNGPLYPVLSSIVPGLSLFRLPSRVLFFTSLATAVLAAASISVLLESAADWKRQWRLVRSSVVVAVTLVAVAVGVTMWSSVPVSSSGLTAWSTWAWLLAVPVLFTVGAAARKSGPRIAVLFVLAAMGAELASFAGRVTATAEFRPRETRDDGLLDPILADSSMVPPRVLAFQDVLSDWEAYQFNVHKVRGYEPAGPAHYLLLMALLDRPGGERLDPMGFMPADLRQLDGKLLDLMGVKYVVQSRPSDQPPSDVDGWRLLDSGGVTERLRLRADPSTLVYPCDLLANDSTLPRAYVVGEARVVSGFSEFGRILPQLESRREVALAADVLPAGERAGFRPARVIEYTPDRVRIEAELEAPGYLVLSDLWSPGWSARTGDISLPVLEANGVFRAVPLPAGRHLVEMTFVSPGWVPGVTISLATWIGFLLCHGLRWLRGREAVAGADRSLERTIEETAAFQFQNAPAQSETADC